MGHVSGDTRLAYVRKRSNCSVLNNMFFWVVRWVTHYTVNEFLKLP